MRSSPHSSIGVVGVAARLAVGLLLVGLALWDEPGWRGFALGLIVMPGVVVATGFVLKRRGSQPFRATGPVGHALNLAVIVPLLVVPATGEAAKLFYGASMLVAAACRNGGCEMTAISNALLQRDDQVGCALFAPVDFAEAARGRPTDPSL